MGRKCFSAYERCTKIMQELKQDVAKALDVTHANVYVYRQCISRSTSSKNVGSKCRAFIIT